VKSCWKRFCKGNNEKPMKVGFLNQLFSE